MREGELGLRDEYVFRHDCAVLDACTVINLYATSRMGDILQAAPLRCKVASYVHQREALYVFDGIDDSGQKVRTPIDITPVIAAGLVDIVEPDLGSMSGHILAFAAEGMGNGEAISGAIATQRSWAIGTDDRKAMKVFAHLVPHLQVISTFDLIRHWASVQNIGDGEVQGVLQNTRLRGRFVLWKDHPLYEWVAANTAARSD